MKNKVCQSCGMPLYKPEMYGTDSIGTRIEDYCQYCFQHGQFTSDVTMEEMINLCAKYVSKNGGNSEQYIKYMHVQFPTLKRWAQKEDTQAEYYKAINRVLDYINDHLQDNNDLETLAQVACISPFHFHRIFKAIIGENPAQYIQRLRLEHVAENLRTNDTSLDRLATESGYNSMQALSKAFKKYFGIPPSIYKITPSRWAVSRAGQLFPRICKIYPKHIIYLRSIDPEATYNNIWQKLYSFAIFSNLLYEGSESLGACFELPDNPDQKPEFCPCLSIEYPITSRNNIEYKEIREGIYAVFTHKGAYKHLTELYKKIWYIWFPESRYNFRDDIIFEKYLNNPASTDENELLTEVYIPVIPKKGYEKN